MQIVDGHYRYYFGIPWCGGGPITSGDTAFRSARLIVADIMRYPQDKIIKRLTLAMPMFAVAVALVFVDFSIIWRYFAFTNQSLAVFTLWTATVWLARCKKTYVITLVPAVFMTMVCSTYILIAPEGLQLNADISYFIGGGITVGVVLAFFWWMAKNKKTIVTEAK